MRGSVEVVTVKSCFNKKKTFGMNDSHRPHIIFNSNNPCILFFALLILLLITRYIFSLIFV